MKAWKVIKEVSLIISKKQGNELETLEADQNIVIMLSDKDSSIVILNKNDYNEKCLKILCDRHFY